MPPPGMASWRPAVIGVDDGQRVSAPIGSYAPNPFGLHDMAGNVAEWTSSRWRPTYTPGDAAPNGPVGNDERAAVRGGSWRDRPIHARSASRLAYRPWQKVVDVGFRVVLEDGQQRDIAGAY